MMPRRRGVSAYLTRREVAGSAYRKRGIQGNLPELAWHGAAIGVDMPFGPRGTLDQLIDALRVRHYSPRTEEAYVGWARRFAAFHRYRDPRTLTEADISAFVSHVGAQGVSASTQNQALGAILFLYQVVLKRPVPALRDITRARPSTRLPVVLSHSEVAQLLSRLTGVEWLMAAILYGGGLRVMECVELRVKDVRLDRGELIVRQGKGAKDRVTMLPVALRAPLLDHLRRRKAQHERDLAAGCGSVALPDQLHRNYPHAPLEWGWQWVFPATRFYVDPDTGCRRRHHLHESVLQKAVKRAAVAARLPVAASCHTLRHSFARLLEAGYDIHVQELPGHVPGTASIPRYPLRRSAARRQ
ncbi:MAG: integron integrase [Vicinamibacterales bacterium]